MPIKEADEPVNNRIRNYLIIVIVLAIKLRVYEHYSEAVRATSSSRVLSFIKLDTRASYLGYLATMLKWFIEHSHKMSVAVT